MKKTYLAWCDWKNPDEMKSRILSDTSVKLELIAVMTYKDFAELMTEVGRKEFKITIET